MRLGGDVHTYLLGLWPSFRLQLDVRPLSTFNFSLARDMAAQFPGFIKDFAAIERQTSKMLFSDFNHFLPL